LQHMKSASDILIKTPGFLHAFTLYVSFAVFFTFVVCSKAETHLETEREKLLDTARDYEKERSYDKAIGVYEKILEGDSESADNLDVEYRLAELYNNLGRSEPDYVKATAILNEIFQKYDPKRYRVIMAHVKLAELYFRQGGHTEEAMEQFGIVLKIGAELEVNTDGFNTDEIEKIKRSVQYCKNKISMLKLERKRLESQIQGIIDAPMFSDNFINLQSTSTNAVDILPVDANLVSSDKEQSNITPANNKPVASILTSRNRTGIFYTITILSAIFAMLIFLLFLRFYHYRKGQIRL
jgi:tetratricopeptide (TPR) repeat protein